MKLARVLTLALIAIFLLSFGFAASRLSQGVDTDILSLLPGDAHDPVLADALQKASAVASNRVAFAIEGGTPASRRAAASDLTSRLQKTGLFQTSDGDAAELWRWLFAHRASMLCPVDRKQLEAGKGAAIAREAMLQWYAPMTVGGTTFLKSDPLLLTNRLLGCLLPKSIRLGLSSDSEIISGSISASVYRLDVQDRITAAIDGWQADPLSEGLTLSRAGAVFHAAYGAAQARYEMSVIGGITTVAVLLFYWMMFYSLRAPLIAVGMVVFSLSIGLAAAFLLFGHVHAMALVFGAALIGMVVDYTTYYLVTGLTRSGDDVATRRKRIVRPLTLGMVTSVGAFVALLFFPVPAFRQIALFGSVGLLAAWAGTLLLTPRVEGGAMRRGPGAILTRRMAERFLARQPGKRATALIVGVAIVVVVAGYFQGRTLDDVRHFQAPSPELAAEEARIRDLTGFAPSGSFILVQGLSRDAATAAEERLIAVLEGRGGDDQILWAASRFDPSQAQTRRDARLIESKLIEPHLAGVLAALGVQATVPYKAEATSDAAVPGFVRDLRGQTGPVYWSILPVTGRMDALPDIAGVQYVDPAQRYSDLFAQYRQNATYGLVAAAAVTALLLLIVYRRLAALRILLPTILALCVTPAVMSLFGMPYSFFSAMGLFLVAGAGVDYSIFQWETPGRSGDWTRVGIVLAAAMTCISVGLLGLSSVLPVRSFGLTVAIGVLLSLTLSPLVRGWGGKSVIGGKHDK
jgi:predicted exporter